MHAGAAAAQGPLSRVLAGRAAAPAAAAAGLASALGFEPTGWWPAAALAVAVLLLQLAARPRAGFALGLAFGVGHFAFGLRWIAEAFGYQSAMPVWMGWVAVGGLALFLALYPALAAAAAGALLLRLAPGAPPHARLPPLALLLAGSWTIAEILRGILFTGFPWNPLGAALLPAAGLSQLAAVLGASGLSALLVLVAGALAAAAAAVAARRRPTAPLLLLAAAAALDLGLRLALPGPAIPEDAPRILLVQPGTGIAEKHGEGGPERSLIEAADETRRALARLAGPPPAAVIWPEATIPFPLEELPQLRQELGALLPRGAVLLAGGNAFERDRAGRLLALRNSLYAIADDGRILARYDKAHLVPGGEYLPLRPIAEPLGLARLVPGSLDFWPGPGPVGWELPGLPRLAPSICYEIIFPAAVIAPGPRPAAIVTVSNDAWFGPAGPPQHHAQARLRAIEEGLPVLRVTPTGLSGLIGPGGERLLTLPRGQPASAVVPLPAPRPATPFARAGLVLPLGLAALLLAAGLLLARRRTT